MCNVILSTFLCCHLQNNNGKWPNSALQFCNCNWAILKTYISNLMLCSTTIFEIVLTNRNKLNDFRVSGDPQVKYKVIFNWPCPWCCCSSSSICSGTAFCILLEIDFQTHAWISNHVCLDLFFTGYQGHPRDPNKATQLVNYLMHYQWVREGWIKT